MSCQPPSTRTALVRTLAPGTTLSVGRDPGCDLILEHASVSRRLGEVVYELMAQVDRVVDTFFKCQIAVSLAVVREHLPYVCLPMRYNFANDPLLEALHASELPHLTILHLLRDHQGVDKQRVFASLGAMEALAAREDLKVVNLRARDVLREVLPLIRADRGLA